MLGLIRSLGHERGAAVLLSSHLLHQVQSVCDRVGIFVQGRMVAEGPMAELAERLATGAVTVEVGAEGDPRRVEEALRSALGVTAVEPDSRDPRLWIVTGDRDAPAAAARALAGAGLAPWHLRRRGEDLDEIYQRYFQQAAREEVRTGAPAR
jgi:ABC-2 type transport system ATP-binding protein